MRRECDSRRFAFSSPLILHSPAVPSLIFCRCGSDRVDVKNWNGPRARIECLTCGQEAGLEGFTLGEFDLSKLVVGALVDQARKHRRRSPTEQQAIEKARGKVG